MKTIQQLFSLFTLTFLLVLGSACNSETAQEESTKLSTELEPENKMQSMTAVAVLSPKSNSSLSGTVTFVQDNDQVVMKAEVSGAGANNTQAIHIHEAGDCSADDGTSAGGHWNPTGQPHGKWGDEAFHIGDIGNLQTDAQGNARIERTTDLWCVGCGDPNREVVGKAIIVHEGPDDFSSQPSGAAGPRVGCGVIDIQ